jgi:hypothetical protein
MKKTIRNLVVRRETLRALHALDSRDLAGVVGADGSGDGCPVPQRETGKTCAGQVATPTFACG